MSSGTQRIVSIDILRGLVMVVMALDHVRDYFHNTAFTVDPLDVKHPDTALFFTRWITHYCAPIFVFLAGISIYISGRNKDKQQHGNFLITRGLWLLLMECTIITFGWTFDPGFHILILQVIWAIGISMVVLGLLVRLPYIVSVCIAILVALFHNTLDYAEATHKGPFGFVWDALHHGKFSMYFYAEGHGAAVVYPVLPWIGIMTLGYILGRLYEPSNTIAFRKKWLLYLGTGMIILFIILRTVNIYGDPQPWEAQETPFQSFLAFIRVCKYPPSLIFTCMTIGPALILLALFENTKGKISSWLSVFGKVPFFYYILHIYLIHLLSVGLFFVSGFGTDDIASPGSPFLFRPANFGVDLWAVYLVWLVVIGILYFPCRWYEHYKRSHKHWWLHYM